ncbi:MAG: T9SS type A sorting domain-containing protein [Ferruginibacter sp.]|nr:T9SS type A sorting domain-containing protein [Ferruginibacter sp.]
MKCKLLLSATLLSLSISSLAQDASRTYAITGKASNNFFWGDIKQVDISTGKVNKTLFEADKTTFKFNNLDKSSTAARASDNKPTGFGVAACALDTRHNRLYFATMHFSDIRYIDLSQPGASFTTIKRDVVANPAKGGYQTEENHITRMVIGADGNGYALTNDANHLIRFSTGNKAVIEDLGNLVDDESSKGISIHNKCTSWGGDMVADAFGKLVIVSANHNVFSIDPASRIVTHKGVISGLPANFTTNGAAVNDEGLLVVSSANVFEGLYKLSMKDLVASKVASTEAPFNASDLANGNFLNQKEANDLIRFDNIKPRLGLTDGRVYPNPSSGSQFNILFENQPTGKYTILLTDLAGRALQSKVVSIAKPGQVETMRVTGKTARGMYLVKVLTDSKQLAFSEKLVIQ